MSFSASEAASSAGFVTSTAEDMSIWLKFLLSEGKTSQNVSLLRPEALDEVFKPEIMTPEHSLEEDFISSSYIYGSYYAKGMYIGQYRGKFHPCRSFIVFY